MLVYIIPRRKRSEILSASRSHQCLTIRGAPEPRHRFFACQTYLVLTSTWYTEIGGGGGPSGGVLHVKNALQFREGKAYHTHSQSTQASARPHGRGGGPSPDTMITDEYDHSTSQTGNFCHTGISSHYEYRVKNITIAVQKCNATNKQ